jgi:hypothetical protein
MGSSTTQAETLAPPPGLPREERLASVAALVRAQDDVIALARRHIKVFDVDLSWGGWNTASRCDALSSYLRRVPGGRFDIIVHDTRYLQSACPHMVSLLRNYGHAVTIYQTGPEGKVATDPLVIVDGKHYLHRFHFEQPRAALGIDQPEQTRPLASRFDEIWATGESGLSGTVLGL